MDVEVVTRAGDADVVVGRLHPHRRRGIESATFVYDDLWLARRDAYELEPGLPLRAGSFQTRRGLTLFGCFADSAPDRWGRTLIVRAERRRADREGVAARSLGDTDFLLGVRDDLRQGALRFRIPPDPEFVAGPESGVPHLVELPRLLDAAARVERDEPQDADLSLLLRAGSSLGGARPKAHVVMADGRLAIAKFPSVAADGWDVMAWEWVSLTLAGAAGLRVAAAELLTVDGRHVLAVDRFDRRGEDRIGYVSAMTMLEASDGDIRSYLEIAETLEQFSSDPTTELRELWGRMAFSVLISNTDDHLRNHGFLRSGRGWVLSPAFDINPDPSPGPKHLRTAIDEYDTSASIETLMSVAPLFRLADADARGILGRAETALTGWRAVAEQAGVPGPEIDLMTTAFEGDERGVARKHA